MKKLLALLGSPHPCGITSRLMDTFLGCPILSDMDMEVKKINVYNENIMPCDGCGACAVSYGCKKADNSGLFGYFEQSDALIFATPVYLLSFPAPMKAVFDRFQQYYNARFSLGMKPPVEKPKKAFLIITQGGESGEGENIITRQCRMAFSVMNTEICGIHTAHNMDNASDKDISREIKSISGDAESFFSLF